MSDSVADGKQDLVIAFRGTITSSEWLADFDAFLIEAFPWAKVDSWSLIMGIVLLTAVAPKRACTTSHCAEAALPGCVLWSPRGSLFCLVGSHACYVMCVCENCLISMLRVSDIHTNKGCKRLTPPCFCLPHMSAS